MVECCRNKSSFIRMMDFHRIVFVVTLLLLTCVGKTIAQGNTTISPDTKISGNNSFPNFGGNNSFPDFGGNNSFPDFGGNNSFPDFGGNNSFLDFGGNYSFPDFGGGNNSFGDNNGSFPDLPDEIKAIWNPDTFKKDIKNTFNTNLLNNRYIKNTMQSYFEEDSVIMDVLTGNSSLNDIPDEDWNTMPVKLLQGFKRDAIQEMSPEKLATLLDSDEASRDPSSLARILNKLDLDQFKDALEILTEKMFDDEEANWRPPVSIQNVVANSFFSYHHGSRQDTMDSFLTLMCPFVAGVDSWQIMRLPEIEDLVESMIECFDFSYKDLTSFQRRSLVNWVHSAWKNVDIDAEKLQMLKNFVLDLPFQDIRSALTLAEIFKYVDSGILKTLDSGHMMFPTVAGFIMHTIVQENATYLNDKDTLKKLGKAKCEIKVSRVRNALDGPILKHLLDYTMQECKNREDELADSYSECQSDTASRLQRCELLEREMAKFETKSSFSSYSSFSSSSVVVKHVVAFERPTVQEYQNMKVVMSLFQEENTKSFSQFNSSDIRSVASAFSVLKPKEIDEIPDDAILENMDVLKNNTNLSSRQKRKLYTKMVSAGFEVTSSESIMELGEFVTSVRPDDFRKLDAEGIKESLGELSKHAKDFSRAQKKAIVETLNDGNVTDIIQKDLGDLAGEIPVADLANVDISKENLEAIGKQKWDRGQAANLFRNYRRSAGLNSSLSVSDIREMGHTSVGLACKDISDILDDEAYDATKALVEETDGSLTLDMIECAAKKLHASMQSMHGAEYISNETDPDLATSLEYIPEDIAMMMPIDQLEMVPKNACMVLMGNIGKANLDLIASSDIGLVRRKSLADITMKCIEENRSPDDSETIGVSEALTFGQLICDLDLDHWLKLDLDSFMEMLMEISDCFYRLSEDKINHIRTRIHDKYGSDTSTWTEDVVAVIGRMVALLDEDDIANIPEDVAYESMDSMSPPELDESLPAHKLMNYDAVYGKFIDSVMSQRAPADRRRREVTAPTYDEIVLLGAGNSAWSVEDLEAISDDDFSNALSILGAIDKWSDEQLSALLNKLKSIQGTPATWDSKVIGDAQQLLMGLNDTELDSLVIDDIEIFTQLSNVNFTSEEKYMLVESYLEGASTRLSALTSSELAGFNSVACGIEVTEFDMINDSVIKSAIKDLGELNCFTQDQYDFLKGVAVLGLDSPVPSAPALNEMGSIAAGLSAEDLSALPVDAIEFIKPIAFFNTDPTRIRDGLNVSQMLAAGIGNIAAFTSDRVFNQLTAEQQSAVNESRVKLSEEETAVTTAATPDDNETEAPDNDANTDSPNNGDGTESPSDNDAKTESPSDNDAKTESPSDNEAKTESPDDVTESPDDDTTGEAPEDVTDDVDVGDNSAGDATKATDSETTKTTTTTTTTPADGSSAAILPSFYSVLLLFAVSAILI